MPSKKLIREKKVLSSSDFLLKFHTKLHFTFRTNARKCKFGLQESFKKTLECMIRKEWTQPRKSKADFLNSDGVLPVNFLNTLLKVDFELNPHSKAIPSIE